MKPLLATCSASITELKKNPTALIAASEGAPVAILNHNTPTAYLIPAETYEELLDQLEDKTLSKVIQARQHEKSKAIRVSLDDL